MAMMVVVAAVLLNHGVYTGNAMSGKSGSGAGENSVLPLDMAENSVDDSYDGCKDKMMKKAIVYLENEKDNDKKFKKVWESSENVARNKFSGHKYLGIGPIAAIYYYTSGEDDAYLDFNAAVRAQRLQYENTFRYHALHFLLTIAIQAERDFEENQRKEKYCLTVFRRVNQYFNQDVKNKQFRFGSFTSASMGDYHKNEDFGTKSCFEIVTCMGADVSLYSKFEDAEREVLIPPYEVFKVQDVENSSKEKKLKCDVVYKVKSIKTPVSNLNCALFK